MNEVWRAKLVFVMLRNAKQHRNTPLGFLGIKERGASMEMKPSSLGPQTERGGLTGKAPILTLWATILYSGAHNVKKQLIEHIDSATTVLFAPHYLLKSADS